MFDVQELLDLRHKLEQDSKRLAEIFSLLFILDDGNGQLIFPDISSTELASLFFRYFVFNYFSRLAEICAAIEEMERRQREAELRRLKAQNQEWIKDFRPEGAAEFGSMPSFRWVQML